MIVAYELDIGDRFQCLSNGIVFTLVSHGGENYIGDDRMIVRNETTAGEEYFLPFAEVRLL